MDGALLVVLLGAAAAGFAQGVSGFAFSLVALSIWAWVVPPQTAAVMAVAGALLGQLVALPFIWRGFDLGKLLPLVAGGVVGVPIGAALLTWLDPALFRFGLGAFLLVYCPLMLKLPHDVVLVRGERLGDALAGLGGGIMGGIGGIAGPVPTLWTTLRGWSKEIQRGVLQAFNIAIHVITLGVYGIGGLLERDALGMLMLISPAVALPALVGVQLFHRLNAAAFRRVILGLLWVSGLGLIWGSAGKWL